MEFISRFRSPLPQYTWFAWLGFAVYLTLGPLEWHIEYFKGPGLVFYRAILVVLPALAVGTVVYAWLRRKGLWRYEPLLFGALLLAAALFYEPRATVTALGMLAAAYASGRFCLERLAIITESYTEDLALSSAVGFGLQAAALFVIGMADGYYVWTFAALLLAPCLLFYRQLAQLPLNLWGAWETWRGDEELARARVGVPVALAAVYFVCTLMLTLAPSIAVDMMLFHLAEVKHYVEHHGLWIVPSTSYSYFPQGGEVLMTLAYALGGQTAAQMVNPLFFLLTLFLLYALARRLKLSRGVVVAGIVFAATVPFLHWTGSTFKNDFPLVLYQLGSLYCFIRNRDEDGDHWIYVGVFLLASSFGVKHTAAFGAIPLGLLYLTVTWRRPRLLLICFAIGLIFGFHWHARTFQLTGNPLYPAAAENASVKLPSMLGTRPSMMALYVSYPWIVHFEGRRSFESPSSNPCGIFLVLFTPAWIWARRKRRLAPELICLFAVAVHIVYLGYLWLILRYAMLPFMILVILTASRLMACYELSGRFVRGTLLGAMIYSMLFGLLPAMIVEINGPQLSYFAGRLDREQYLAEAVSYYPSVRYLAENAPHDALILSVSNAARAFAASPGRFHFISARQGLLDSIDDTRLKMARFEFDYVVVPTPMARRFEELIGPRYPLEDRYNDRHYTVFAVGKPPAGS